MCGIFGVFLGNEVGINLERVISAVGLNGSAFVDSGSAAAGLTYFGLVELQNRGQDSSGIVVSDGESLKKIGGPGLVIEAYKKGDIQTSPGDIVIGHNRYSTTGKPRPKNVQPFIRGHVALAHNGNIVNQDELKGKLEDLVSGIGKTEELKLRTTTDSEVLLNLVVAYMLKENCTLEEAIASALNLAVGSYSLVIATKDKLIGVRDPYENRPLHVGRLGEIYMLSSEVRVFDRIRLIAGYRKKEGDFSREVERGEIVTITKDGLKGHKNLISLFNPDGTTKKPCVCSFEYSYLMKDDEPWVYSLRTKCGERLWGESPVDKKNAVIVHAPDSGLIASEGYSRASGIHLASGIRRSHYYQRRTFIEHYQKGRDIGALIKYYAIPEAVEGKNVVVADDSIVRATTMSNIIKLLRLGCNVNEIHLRIATPPYITPCYLGIHTPEKDELIANGLTQKQVELYFMARFYGVDYNIDNLKEIVLKNSDIRTIVEQSIRDNENYLTDKERGKIDPNRFSLRYLSLPSFKECFGEKKNKMCYTCFTPNGEGYPPEMRPYLAGKV